MEPREDSDARESDMDSPAVELTDEESPRLTDIPRDFGTEPGEQRESERMLQEERQHAIELSQDGKHRQAMETFNSLLESDIDVHQRVRMNLREDKDELLHKLLEKARQLEREGNFDRALEIVTEIDLMGIYPREVGQKFSDIIRRRKALSLYDMAEEARMKGDIDQAKLHLTRARSAHPFIENLVEHGLLYAEESVSRSGEIEALRFQIEQDWEGVLNALDNIASETFESADRVTRLVKGIYERKTKGTEVQAIIRQQREELEARRIQREAQLDMAMGLLRQARKHESNSDWVAAMQLYHKALSMAADPNRVRINLEEAGIKAYMSAESLVRDGKIEEALEIVTKVTQFLPHHSHAANLQDHLEETVLARKRQEQVAAARAEAHNLMEQELWHDALRYLDDSIAQLGSDPTLDSLKREVLSELSWWQKFLYRRGRRKPRRQQETVRGDGNVDSEDD